MSSQVILRTVRSADLPTLFEHQLDAEAARLAAFTSRPRDAFMAHWANLLSNPANLARTILHAGRIVGNIGAWSDSASGERLVGYWIGRECWGQGIASAALAQFLAVEKTRPLTARVAPHNPGSIRVLQKCGFTIVGAERLTAGSSEQPAEEVVLTLAWFAPGPLPQRGSRNQPHRCAGVPRPKG